MTSVLAAGPLSPPDYDFAPESKNLAVYISYLRRKLEPEGTTPLIQTVRGVGYTLRPK